jgi:N-methylhydantoinase B
LEIITPGAGGYGPPSRRPHDAVRRDLVEGRMDAAAARAAYGVE